MPGDTLAGIAIKYDLNMEDIKQTNGLYYDSDLISAYTHLKIPCSVPPLSEPTSFSSFTGCEKSIGPPCHTKFDLFSIVLGKSDETMPYRLDLGNSFGVVYIAVTYLVQELC